MSDEIADLRRRVEKLERDLTHSTGWTGHPFDKIKGTMTFICPYCQGHSMTVPCGRCGGTGYVEVQT